MTVRRDLAELEEKGLLTKIHGGARSNSIFQFKEKSHQEKHTQYRRKRSVARKAIQIIEENDTIFLGPGTTIECLAEIMELKSLTVITNCFPVFKILFERSINFKVYLLGGEMRDLTESFVGEMANTLLKTMRFSKMFLVVMA